MSEEKTRRITFSFDERSYEDLSKMVKQERFTSMERCCGARHHSCFPKPEPTGIEEVVIRNPETGQERILIVPTYE